MLPFEYANTYVCASASVRALEGSIPFNDAVQMWVTVDVMLSVRLLSRFYAGLCECNGDCMRI